MVSSWHEQSLSDAQGIRINNKGKPTKEEYEKSYSHTN